jgi:hypothetical protein
MTALERFDGATITPLRGGRRDVDITGDITPFGTQDVFSALRRLFVEIDSEASNHVGEPVPLVQALAHLDALVADLRMVRDNVKRLAADALQAERVRRLTISDVCTVESSTETVRTGWRHADLTHTLLEVTGHRIVSVETGEVLDASRSANWLLHFVTPSWKLTGLREVGIDPDDWCDTPKDDDGNTIRTNTVRIRDNGKRD